MPWTKLKAGDMARCKCGRTDFVRVGAGRAMWFTSHPRNSPIPSNVDVYVCRRPACKPFRYLGLSLSQGEDITPPAAA